MKRINILLVLVLVVQAGLILFLSFRGTHGVHADNTRALVSFSPAQVQAIEIGDGTEKLRLTRSGENWILPDHFQAPADRERIDALLDRLAASRMGWPVATTVDTARRFKVAKDDYKRKLTLFSTGNTPLVTLYIGSSPGYSKSYVRPAGQAEIVTLNIGLYDLPVDADAWVAPDLLRMNRKTISSITFPGFTLEQSEKGFVLAGENPERLDRNAVDSLVDSVLSPRISGVLGREEKPDFHLTPPLLTYTLKDEEGSEQTCRLGMLDSDKGYALSCSGQPLIGRLDKWSGQPIAEASREKLLKKEDRDKDQASAPPVPVSDRSSGS